jgi:hypothetical protein
MSARSGPDKEIYANAAIVADSTWYAMDTFKLKAKSNSIRLYSTLTTGGCGTIKFKVDVSRDEETSYYPLINEAESPAEFGPFTAASAGNYAWLLEGINVTPGDWVKLYFQVSSIVASPEFQTYVVAFDSASHVENTAVQVAVDAIEVDTSALDGTVVTDGSAKSATSLQVAGEDGTNAQTLKTDSDGHLQTDVLTMPGGLTGHAEDDAHTTADVGVFALSVRADSAATTADTDGDYAAILTDANGRLHCLDANSAAIKTAVEIIDDWDETDRCAVNAISGQVGVAGGSGANGATVQRVTVATDDTVATDLTAIKTAVEIIDDWDETDRCKSNIIVGQAGVAAGSGANGVTVQRVTVATDDTVATDLTAIKTATEIMDDWDESDRCKSNPIVGQAGVAAGSGANGATVQRVTVATDDTVATDLTAIKTAVEILDDFDESDRCKVNIISGQAGIAADTGVLGATVQRTTSAIVSNFSNKYTANTTNAIVVSPGAGNRIAIHSIYVNTDTDNVEFTVEEDDVADIYLWGAKLKAGGGAVWTPQNPISTSANGADVLLTITGNPGAAHVTITYDEYTP